MVTSGRVCSRSSDPQVISLGALAKWKMWSLDIRGAFLEADGLGPEIHLRAPDDCGPSNANRISESHVPAYGLNDAPVQNMGRCKSTRWTPWNRWQR